MQCFIWEVGCATASVQACVTRVLASNSLRRPRAPSSLASRRDGDRSGSSGRGAQRGQHSKALSATAALATAALTVAALAATCSGFRLLARAGQIGLIDERAPPRPLAAGGRLTLNTLTRGAERRQSPGGDRYVAVTPVSPL